MKPRRCSFWSIRLVSHKTWALAKVACPHSSTSTDGVNQRKFETVGLLDKEGRLREVHLACQVFAIHVSSAGFGSTQTPAGLPANGRSVKASTW